MELQCIGMTYTSMFDKCMHDRPRIPRSYSLSKFHFLFILDSFLSMASKNIRSIEREWAVAAWDRWNGGCSLV